MLSLVPTTIAKAREFIDEHHRHHKSPQGGLFAVGISNEGTLVGVAIIGRPVARALQDGFTAEVTRLCVLENIPNGCSMLYSAAWRAAKSLGYKKMITYILHTEPGISLKAAGWLPVARVVGRSWDTPSRRRTDKHPTIDKIRWEISCK